MQQAPTYRLISLQSLIFSLSVTFITSSREAAAFSICLSSEKEVCDVRGVPAETIEAGVC